MPSASCWIGLTLDSLSRRRRRVSFCLFSSEDGNQIVLMCFLWSMTGLHTWCCKLACLVCSCLFNLNSQSKHTVVPIRECVVSPLACGPDKRMRHVDQPAISAPFMLTHSTSASEPCHTHYVCGNKPCTFVQTYQHCIIEKALQ